MELVLFALCIMSARLREGSRFIESQVAHFLGFNVYKSRLFLPSIVCHFFNSVFSFLVVPKIIQLELDGILECIKYVPLFVHFQALGPVCSYSVLVIGNMSVLKRLVHQCLAANLFSSLR